MNVHIKAPGEATASYIARQHAMLIDGEWVQAASGAPLKSWIRARDSCIARVRVALLTWILPCGRRAKPSNTAHGAR